MTLQNSSSMTLIDLRELHLAEDQASLKQALPGAAQRGELTLVYQPIVAAVDGQLTVSAKAWRPPTNTTS
jgi:sensor c-di-GMP phosphodiesterase-like protein